MSIASTVLAQTPAVYWKLDDPTAPAASDSSGNGHNGIYGGTFSLLAKGPEDGTFAAWLSGGGAVVSGAASPSLGRVSHTYSFFVSYSQANTGSRDLVGIGDAARTLRGTSAGITVSSPATFGSWGRCLPTVSPGSTTIVPYPVNLWHHVAVVFDTAVNLVSNYIDGVLDRSLGYPTPGASYVVSANPDPFIVTVAGSAIMAHVALFTRALTAAQLLTIAANVPVWPFSERIPLVSDGTVATLTQQVADTATLAAILAAVRHTFPTT